LILRPENNELTDIEKKNIKKQLQNAFVDFPEKEDTYEDSKAA
jgi:hypothetical protein